MSAAVGGWTLASVRGAAEPIAHARGLSVQAFMVGGTHQTAVRIEFMSGGEVTCWTELPAKDLDEAAEAAPGSVAELVEREVAHVLRMRHGAGAAA